MVTAIHMFRRVLGNTPSSCSSTKLDELSKPEIRRRAALNPKKSAARSPPGGGLARFRNSVLART